MSLFPDDIHTIVLPPVELTIKDNVSLKSNQAATAVSAGDRKYSVTASDKGSMAMA